MVAICLFSCVSIQFPGQMGLPCPYRRCRSVVVACHGKADSMLPWLLDHQEMCSEMLLFCVSFMPLRALTWAQLERMVLGRIIPWWGRNGFVTDAREPYRRTTRTPQQRLRFSDSACLRSSGKEPPADGRVARAWPSPGRWRSSGMRPFREPRSDARVLS